MEPDLTPQSPATDQRDSYAFLMNVKSLRGGVSLQLADGHEIRRATSTEIVEIKANLNRLVMNPFVLNLWEWEWPFEAGRQMQRLPEHEWRYFVIAFSGVDIMPSGLGEALDLAPVELDIAFTTTYSQAMLPSWSYHPDRFFHAVRTSSVFDQEFFVEIGSAEVAEIREIHTLLQGQGSQPIEQQKRLSRQLGDLKGLPRESPLRFLGYFGLLESLLTHAPQPTDPYDSITRQIVKKLALLNHRLRHPIGYGPFGGSTPETVWKKMYGCRSVVAHGGEPDFTKEFKLLKSQKDALSLVKETAKAIIVHALREPELLADLREC